MSRKQQLVEKLTQIISDRLEDDASLNEAYMDSLRKNFIPIVLSVIGGTAALLSTPLGKSKVEKHKYEIIDKAVESGYEQEQAEEVLDTILSGDELSGRMTGIEKIKKKKELVNKFTRERADINNLYDEKSDSIRRDVESYKKEMVPIFADPYKFAAHKDMYIDRLVKYDQLLKKNAQDRQTALQVLSTNYVQQLAELEAIPVAYP